MQIELNESDKEGILRVLAFAAFLVFFNGYMIAPLIPTLALEMGATNQQMGLIVPAYLIPYGISTLFYGPLCDRIGRKKVLFILLFISILTCIANAFVPNVEAFIGVRLLSGICAGGINPISLALIGDLYPYKQLGRAMGWIFGAIAGGMSFGSTLGAWLNPFVGWKNELFLLAIANAVALVLVIIKLKKITDIPDKNKTFLEVFRGYRELVKNPRGGRTYTFIFFNGVFHSGVFTWLGLYLNQRYGLGDIEVGIALLGYGLPGMLLGPYIGKLADRHGRHLLIPAGFLLASLCVYMMIPTTSVWIFAVAVTFLSFGLDMSHPLMAGIILSVDPKRRGQAMGFNAFVLFIGMGLGSLMFQLLLQKGFVWAFGVFATIQLLLAGVGLKVFQSEK